MSEAQPRTPTPNFAVGAHPVVIVAERRRGLETWGVVLIVSAWLTGVATAVLLSVLDDALQDADELGRAALDAPAGAGSV